MATPPVFLPGESHGQRSLACYSPWGHKSQTRLGDLTTTTTTNMCTVQLSLCIKISFKWQELYVCVSVYNIRASLVTQMVKNPPAIQ